MGKKTLVLGASTDTNRYSNRAVRMLKQHHHDVIAVGRQAGEIEGTSILTSLPELKDIDTVTLYLNPSHQQDYQAAILHLKPRRIIFNPGTENFAFKQQASALGIETENACTLVMLQTGQY